MKTKIYLALILMLVLGFTVSARPALACGQNNCNTGYCNQTRGCANSYCNQENCNRSQYYQPNQSPGYGCDGTVSCQVSYPDNSVVSIKVSHHQNRMFRGENDMYPGGFGSGPCSRNQCNGRSRPVRNDPPSMMADPPGDDSPGDSSGDPPGDPSGDPPSGSGSQDNSGGSSVGQTWNQALQNMKQNWDKTTGRGGGGSAQGQ